MLIIYLSMVDSESDREKVKNLFDLYYGTMFYNANSILNDRALADDAVAESMIKLIKNLNKIGDISCYETKGYIVTIVRNTSLDMLRGRKRKKEETISDDFDMQDGDISFLDNLVMKDSCALIVKCIQSIPKTLSDTLYLSAVRNHTNEEIAKELGITVGAVRMRLSRARKEVRKLLVKEGILYEK